MRMVFVAEWDGSAFVMVDGGLLSSSMAGSMLARAAAPGRYVVTVEEAGAGKEGPSKRVGDADTVDFLADWLTGVESTAAELEVRVSDLERRTVGPLEHRMANLEQAHKVGVDARSKDCNHFATRLYDLRKEMLERTKTWSEQYGRTGDGSWLARRTVLEDAAMVCDKLACIFDGNGEVVSACAARAARDAVRDLKGKS